MLKITDQDTKVINENQLKILKNKSVSPLKFISPPKQILEALQLVNNLKTRQDFSILELKSEIEDPECTNQNSLQLRLKLMQESRNKLNATLCSIIKHLIAHKFKGIDVIGCYTHPGQPHVQNWHEVSINGDLYYVNLTTARNSDQYNVPFKGMFKPLDLSERPPTLRSDLTISEAMYICDEYNYKILKKRAKTKDLNKRINTHNRVVKILKVRIQHGLTIIETGSPPKANKKAHQK